MLPMALNFSLVFLLFFILIARLGAQMDWYPTTHHSALSLPLSHSTYFRVFHNLRFILTWDGVDTEDEDNVIEKLTWTFYFDECKYIYTYLCITRISMLIPFQPHKPENTVNQIRIVVNYLSQYLIRLPKLMERYFTDEYSLGFKYIRVAKMRYGRMSYL